MELRPPESSLNFPPRASTRQPVDDFDEPLIASGGGGINHNPYGYRGYDGPDRGGHNERLQGDEKQRIEWRDIKVQVFRLPNGVIMHAKTEPEAGAYRGGGAKLVDTIYLDD